MSKPAILTVDDDPMVSAAIGRDLLARYGADYRVVRATSGPEALDLLARLASAGRPGGDDRRGPADAADDRDRDAGAGAHPRPRREVPAADRLRGHGRGDHRHQRDRARLLPDEAVGPALRAALPRRRRPPRRLAEGPPRADLRRPRGRAPVVRPQPRDQAVPDPQPRRLPLVRRRAGHRGGAAGAPRRGGADRPPARAGAGRGDPPGALDAGGRGRARPAHHRAAAALRHLHRGRRTGRAGRRCVRRVGGPEHRHRGTRGARRPGRGRAPRSRTTSGSRAA